MINRSLFALGLPRAATFLLVGFFSIGVAAADEATQAKRVLRAGAFAIEVSPQKFPIAVSGGILPIFATKVNDPRF